MNFSPAEDFDEAYRVVKACFAKNVTKSKAWRRRQLKCLWWMIENNKDAICQATYKDLHKHRFEVLPEICSLQNDILRTLKKLDEWTKDERPARTDLLNFLGGTTVRMEPLGVTLIIGAWNYPFGLLLQPALAAIAAGCAMILKPSDGALASQDLMMKMVSDYMDPNAVRCIAAGPKEMGYILEHRFDHIFYTGSSNVGKIIHAAAAKNLTPCTLELGGQGPAIVCESANIELAAKRIASTKFFNAGQVCLNVNHVLVDVRVRPELVERLKHYFDVFLDGNKQMPEYYTSIINEKHFDRLDKLLRSTSGQIVYEGNRDRATKFFAPAIVIVRPGDILLSEEIFGPILPIIDVRDLDSALAMTRAGEHPLGLYGFTQDAAEKEYILNNSQSGGVTFNDCFFHASAKDAPFGGVGNSGLGSYHGKYGILAFSHLRTHMEGLPAWLESLMWFRYPPYTIQKMEKIASTERPWFDQDGNDIQDKGRWVKGALMVAGLASLSYALVSRGQWDGLASIFSRQ